MTLEYYVPTWDSLQRHVLPGWLVDAKFGVYFHWGIYTVPAKGQNVTWYPHNMYRPGTPQYRYHVETYGDPSKFGYKDFIPQFTAANFDPDAWARLIKEAGAKFAGPVAEHHDGFSMWASKINPWNAGAMGPKRDIVGEMERAIRAQGMKFFVAFHHAENYWFYPHWRNEYDTADPACAGLYGPPHDQARDPGNDWERHEPPSAAFWDQWKAKIFEVIDAYHPDVIWFDFGLRYVPDPYKREMLAYYYNDALDRGMDVAVMYKNDDLPPNIGLLDFELGRSADLVPFRWITDSTVDNQGAWGYSKEAGYKPPRQLIHAMIDQVSKNGAMLLNFGPQLDGEIPQGAQDVLRSIGAWLAINGEAIHGSTPWLIAGEGPIKTPRSGAFSESREVVYTRLDFRFVMKDHAIYVFLLGWPGEQVLIKTLVKSLQSNGASIKPRSPRSIMAAIKELNSAGPPLVWRGKTKRRPYTWKAALDMDRYLRRNGDIRRHYFLPPSEIAKIEMLGVDAPLEWSMTPDGLLVHLPTAAPCQEASTLKISLMHE